jgi:hypothetical protein
MTPKEKAKELVDKMYVGFVHDLYSYKAKQCALIAVDEIMKLDEVWYQGSKTYEFYEEVKQEIEKL